MKKNIIFTRGYPSSGKRTYAENWVQKDPDNRININRDDIRKMMGIQGVPSEYQDKTITTIQHAMIDNAFRDGKEIIVSDTNVKEKQMKDIIAKAIEAEYRSSIMDFKMDINTIIKRDKERVDGVGEKNIRDMAKKHPYKSWRNIMPIIREIIAKNEEHNFEPIQQNPDHPKAVIFDVDGTIANMNGRNPFDWENVGDDTVNQNVANIMRMYRDNGYYIIVFSGREYSCYDETNQWFRDNNISYDEFHMRGENSSTRDTRGDDIIKYEMAKKYVENKYYVEAIFDDRDRVVKVWRQIFPDNPTICFQVNYGDF